MPVCQQCNPSTGRCEPANLGAACDDFDVCTAESRCEVIEGFSLCRPGAPTAFTPTATPPVIGVSPTATMPGVDTSTATPTVADTATSTPVGNTATPTQMMVIGTATASPIQSACVGDCNHDLQVRVNELVLGTTIALDLAEVSECPEFDQDNDGRAEINELVLGVNSALNGCAGRAGA